MKRVFWLLPLLALPMAQAQPGLGRLFNTPQERQIIDASRSKSTGSGAAYPRGGAGLTGELAQTEAQRMAGGVSPSMPQGMPPGMQPPVQSTSGMPPGMLGMQMPSSAGMAQGRLPGLAPDVVPDLPPNMPPGMQAEMIAMARAAREMASAQNQAAAMAQQQQQPPPMQQMQQMPMPGASSAAAADTPPPSEQLTMNGVLRSSNGRSTVWLNNQPQRGAANKFTNRDSKAVTVTLPSGKRIVLQPGQRYDLADGRVKDVSQ
ncbi:hypothetical protein [Duganella sp. FT27W]|uniref:hypothetical protein n=1 Tax=Duganella sp. FT27W TaxID=2654636 RepID=UPI00128C62DD|nr:hypothetical protein [Duganella sp. FT27W]MPQ57523.1 hypothetical protein [Duganella sp. FT27W]